MMKLRTIIGCMLCSSVCMMTAISYAQTIDASSLNQAVVFGSTVSSQSTIQSGAPYSGCVEQLFRVSGYYSPKTGQKVYTRDTYEAELRLNGRGIRGASGVPVFNGMIAAPSTYKFGTVIILPGLGTGQVQDRGGAIVSAEGYDRLDVWLGEGDEGIHRAKSLGLRWIVGRYCPSRPLQTVGFSWELIPYYRDFVSVAFWSLDQNIGRSGPLVTLLQGYLRSLGYVSTDIIPAIYNQQMRELVCRYQIDWLGLSGAEDYCGLFGPQTRATLKRQLIQKKIINESSLYTLTNKSSISSVFTTSQTRPARNVQKESMTQSGTTLSSGGIVVPIISFSSSIVLGENSHRIIILQQILQKEGLFSSSVTGIFDKTTKDALAQLQLKYKLIDSLRHVAAGYVGPATRKLLDQKYNEINTML